MRVLALCALLLLVSCGPQIEVSVENLHEPVPEFIKQEYLLPETEEESDVLAADEGRRDITITLIEKEPQTVSIMDEEYTLELITVDNGSAKIRYKGANVVVKDERIVGEDYTMKLLEAYENKYPVPRKSAADISIGGFRAIIKTGEGIEFKLDGETYVAILDFVGNNKNDVPTARVIINGESAMLAEDDEEYLDDGTYVRVHDVFFNDGGVAMVDLATVKFTVR